MIKIIQAAFLIKIFGLEAEVTFGGAVLGEEIAGGIVVADLKGSQGISRRSQGTGT